MKRLLLLRHAKASQEPADGDHGRPLAPRGKRNAPVMGKAMKKHGFVPDRVLCSGAKRTRQTWELLAPALEREIRTEFSDALYLAPWKAILNLMRETGDEVQTLMVVGHNPGLEDCAAALLRQSADADERARRAEMAAKFPTGALAVLDCDIAHWRALAPACAGLAAFLRPRDLD